MPTKMASEFCLFVEEFLGLSEYYFLFVAALIQTDSLTKEQVFLLLLRTNKLSCSPTIHNSYL